MRGAAVKRTVVIMALLIAALCAFLFWNQYGRFLLSGEATSHPARYGLMWGSLTLVALVLAFLASRRT